MNEKNKTKKPELSVVILCYRAENGVYDFVKRVEEIFLKNDIKDYELILVGNFVPGVIDITPKVVREISSKNLKIKFVAEIKKGMMGWDMKSGFEKTQGGYIAVIDGDGQMPIEDLARVFKAIKERKVDLVKTYRLSRGDGIWRKTISFFYNNVFFKLLFPGLKSRDINSKPKIMSREFYKKIKLRSDDWFIDAEIMIEARRLKASIYEISTEFHGLSGKRKSFVKLPAIIEFIKNLIIYRLKEFFK